MSHRRHASREHAKRRRSRDPAAPHQTTAGSRAVIWVVVCLIGLLTPPIPPAAAHASLTRSDPKDGATVERLPDQVELEFSEEVASPAYVEVAAADGAAVGDGDPEVLGATVTLPLTPGGPTGTYIVAYRVTSADGHPVAGELTFDVTSGPAPGSTPESEAPPAADDDTEGFLSRHTDHLVAAGGLLVGALLLGLGRRRARA